MTQTQHTPGPWKADGSVVYGNSGSEGDCHVANCYGPNPNRAIDVHRIGKANARLIAAAPQLLEALKDAQKALDSAEAVWTPGDPPEEIDHWVLDPIPYASATSHIRAAIKDATE